MFTGMWKDRMQHPDRAHRGYFEYLRVQKTPSCVDSPTVFPASCEHDPSHHRYDLDRAALDVELITSSFLTADMRYDNEAHDLAIKMEARRLI